MMHQTPNSTQLGKCKDKGKCKDSTNTMGMMQKECEADMSAVWPFFFHFPFSLFLLASFVMLVMGAIRFMYGWFGVLVYLLGPTVIVSIYEISGTEAWSCSTVPIVNHT